MSCELPHHIDPGEIRLGGAAPARVSPATLAGLAGLIGMVGLVGLAALALRRPLRRAVVIGDSMLPAFAPGDRIVLGPAWRVRPGQVVGLADPRQPGRLMIKRVRRIDAAGIAVEGDNAAASTDSRHFGPVGRSQLAGRVLYRYGPRDRAGWWPQ
jgi:nickel-type superoxide dismutase maturation protease